MPYFECKQKPFKPFIDPKLKRFKEKVEAFADGSNVAFVFVLLLLMTHNKDKEEGAFPIPPLDTC